MIVTVSDESDYLINVTKYMVLSLAKYMPNERLFVVIVNGAGLYDEEVVTWHPNISIMHYSLKLKNKKGFYFTFMALPLFDLMSKFDEPLIYIDGDTIIRGSLAPLFNELEDHDLLVRYRPFCDVQGPMGTEYGGRVNSGVLALANRPQVLEFVLEFKEKIIQFVEEGKELISWNKEKTALTGIDQELLWVLILEHKDKLNFFPLNDKYNDSCFFKDSVVFHAKGMSRKDPRYLIECYKLDRDFIKLPVQLLLRIYKGFKTFITGFLNEPTGNFNIREIGNIITVGEVDFIIIINSSFYIDNIEILKNKNVICYDVDPVIFYKNKNLLKGVKHNFIVKDIGITTNVNEVDLLIYEEALENIVSNVKAKNVVIKNEKI